MISEQQNASHQGVDALRGGRSPDYVLALFGHARLDHGFTGAIPSRLFLHVLARLGVTESAGRATLARLSAQHVLTRVREGRSAAFTLSASGLELITHGRDRILSQYPFEHPEARWTLLSFSIPETRRQLRHQLRARLAWAGFGSLRDGLWISPAAVEAHDLLAGLEDPEELIAAIDLFAARPLEPTTVGSLVGRAFDVPAIRRAHHEFLARWESVDADKAEPLPMLTTVLADWFSLLRADPGLPPTELGSNWPASRSASTFQRLYRDCDEPAHRQFRTLVDNRR